MIWSRRLLPANGIVLIVVGGLQVVPELAAHFAGAGPYGEIFKESPYTIGWVEAHGLAFLVGVLLIGVVARDGSRFWHLFAAAVHFVLVATLSGAWVDSRDSARVY